MKIIVFWEQSEWGGVDSHLEELLINWPEKKDEIDIIYNSGNEGFSRIKSTLLSKDYIRCHKINSFSYSGIISHFNKNRCKIFARIILHMLKPILFFMSIIQIFFYIKKNFKNTDVLLSDNGGYPASWGCLAAIVASKKIGINKRILLIHHGAAKYSFFLKPFEKLIDKLVLKSSTNYIFVSNASKNLFIQNRNKNENNLKFSVIHNEYVIKKVKNSELIQEKINNLVNKKEEDLLIGMLGRITQYKGHEDLINALSTLEKKYLDKVKVIFVGDGEKSEIKRLKKILNELNLANKVFFVGYLEFESRQIVQSFDILMMLTRDFEGFGLTILESIHAKTPFVATNVGAVKEFVGDDFGTLIKPQSPEDIKRSIINFIEESNYYVMKSLKAYELFSNKEIQMHKKYRDLMINHD